MTHLLPPRLVLILLIASVAAGLALPGPGPAPWPVRVIGAPIALAGTALTIAASKVFERLGTNIVTTADPDRLVTTGPFAVSRNPMYLGFVVLLAGAAIVVGSPWAIIGPAGFFAAAERWYIPFEERRAAAVLGSPYEQYRAKVRRWIGRRAITP